ncbi:MAG: YggT family protein [Candidatus Thiodiazotropha sp. (ex Lucinoma aequizonata)]|nr:YggT family protein [Candidatus Thiodiazotropha sp. (ex Lucinoma aequizonata)]MCU7889169.1 YggT family protein [Candidatus Thiodiazotropha sp. (ex Lucinoma aequizonata)]MCU7894830.1 YggT family protein [Candidatus Thiodiazotropha sp. (ex Lucinoma aequizonata)]MCU7898362.1 YggT family protein [Candidatus Thiodiazotropha sp. (ex Lucinoma aequizonata)]MCU7901211.1 YggT family protein [Candidatus Thiodiazotropha sp. (ex Lucinoma aequizonata)]
MDSNYLTNPLVFLIQTLFGLYILAVLLRLLLQFARADFYNPISQFLLKVTNPPLKILRRIIPGIGRIDLSSIILAWLLKAIEILLILVISGSAVNLLSPIVWALPELVELMINIYLFAILIQVILSWVSPGSYNPAPALLYSITGPVMRPVQKLLPPTGGIDFSPMLVMIGLALLKMLLLPPLRGLTGSPFP